MVEVYPVINAETWDEVAAKIKQVESISEWVHIDVANGTMTPNTLWHNPLDLVGLQTNLKLELHIMEDRPEEHIEAWLFASVKRIIVHYEATRDFPIIARECHKADIEAGLAILPKTNWNRLESSTNDADLFQCLAVEPGRAGQRFEAHILAKVKNLRGHFPDAKIEVDGGITPETARACIHAGANILVSSSYVFNHPSPKLALEELRHIQ